MRISRTGQLVQVRKHCLPIMVMLLCTLLSCTKRVEGIVLSERDDNVKWDAVHVDFIYARATSGENIDNEYESFRDNAVKRGIPFGAVCLYDDFEGGNGYSRFQSFKNVVPKGSVDLIPALFVNYPALLQNKEHFFEGVLEWIRLCKEYYGTYPLVFCDEKGLFSQLGMDSILIWSSSLLGKTPIESAKLVFYGSELIPGFSEEVSCVYLNGRIDDIMLLP